MLVVIDLENCNTRTQWRHIYAPFTHLPSSNNSFFNSMTPTGKTFTRPPCYYFTFKKYIMYIYIYIHAWAGQSGDRIPVEARFSAPVQTGAGAHPASYTMGTGSFPGVNWLGRGVDHGPPSSAKVKEKVELCIYSPSGPSWHVLGELYLYLYIYICVCVCVYIYIYIHTHTHIYFKEQIKLQDSKFGADPIAQVCSSTTLSRYTD